MIVKLLNIITVFITAILILFMVIVFLADPTAKIESSLSVTNDYFEPEKYEDPNDKASDVHNNQLDDSKERTLPKTGNNDYISNDDENTVKTGGNQDSEKDILKNIDATKTAAIDSIDQFFGVSSDNIDEPKTIEEINNTIMSIKNTKNVAKQDIDIALKRFEKWSSNLYE